MKKIILENRINEIEKILTKEEMDMISSPSFEKDIRETERKYRTDIYFNEKSPDFKNDSKYDEFFKHLEMIKEYKSAKIEYNNILEDERKAEEAARILKEKNKDSAILAQVLDVEIEEEIKEPEVKEDTPVEVENLNDKIALVDNLCNFFISDMHKRWFPKIVKYQEEMTRFNDKFKNYYITAESREELNKIYSIYPEWLRNITAEDYNNIIKKYVENVKKRLEKRIKNMTIDRIKSYCSYKFNKHLEEIINEVKPML